MHGTSSDCCGVERCLVWRRVIRWWGWRVDVPNDTTRRVSNSAIKRQVKLSDDSRVYEEEVGSEAPAIDGNGGSGPEAHGSCGDGDEPLPQALGVGDSRCNQEIIGRAQRVT